jgi:3-oxoacyl-[acyl-carrier-protein] synthase II
MGGRRVVVTGMGGLCPIGCSWPEVRKSLLEGLSGVRVIPKWGDYQGMKTRLGGPILDFEKPPHYPRKKTRSMGRVALLATRASELAIEDAGLTGDPLLSSGRLGVAYGSSSGSKRTIEVYSRNLHGRHSLRGIAASDFPQYMAHTTSANVAQFFEIHGRQIPTPSACTSGSQAIGFSYENIYFGMQDCMVAGGAEELDVMDVTVFEVMHATSKRNDDPAAACRPFDRDRDGVVVAEGAATLVLEELEHARARGARILGEVVGFGTNTDGKHITDPDTAGMEEAMRLALGAAGIDSDQIGYVNAHATATQKGDIAESQAMERVFGRRIPVSALKSYMGHSLGACGALEAWMSLGMLREGWYAPTLNLDNIDEACGQLDYIRGGVRELDIEYLMTNNFAFGGVNTSIIFRRWPEGAGNL